MKINVTTWSTWQVVHELGAGWKAQSAWNTGRHIHWFLSLPLMDHCVSLSMSLRRQDAKSLAKFPGTKLQVDCVTSFLASSAAMWEGEVESGVRVCVKLLGKEVAGAQSRLWFWRCILQETPGTEKSVCLFSALPCINFILLGAILSERKRRVYLFFIPWLHLILFFILTYCAQANFQWGGSVHLSKRWSA